MLMRTGVAAGYDPFFMAGYAKSLFSSPSSTLFEVAALATRRRRAGRRLQGRRLPRDRRPCRSLVAMACLILGLGGIASLSAW